MDPGAPARRGVTDKLEKLVFLLPRARAPHTPTGKVVVDGIQLPRDSHFVTLSTLPSYSHTGTKSGILTPYFIENDCSF